MGVEREGEEWEMGEDREGRRGGRVFEEREGGGVRGWVGEKTECGGVGEREGGEEREGGVEEGE